MSTAAPAANQQEGAYGVTQRGVHPSPPPPYEKLELRLKCVAGDMGFFSPPKLTYKNSGGRQQGSGRWGEILPRPARPGGERGSRAAGRAVWLHFGSGIEFKSPLIREEKSRGCSETGVRQNVLCAKPESGV